MNDPNSAQAIWQRYLSHERAAIEARKAVFSDPDAFQSEIIKSLETPSERGSALRMLVALPAKCTWPLLHQLVALSAFANSDLMLAREAILRLERAPLLANIESIVEPLLNGADPQHADDEYRRIAELYALLDKQLLLNHLARCRIHQHEDVREVAEDDFDSFKKRWEALTNRIA